MNDHDRIRILLQRLHELRTRDVPLWQLAIRNVAIRSVEDEVLRLSRRIERHLREGSIA